MSVSGESSTGDTSATLGEDAFSGDVVSYDRNGGLVIRDPEEVHIYIECGNPMAVER